MSEPTLAVVSQSNLDPAAMVNQFTTAHIQAVLDATITLGGSGKTAQQILDICLNPQELSKYVPARSTHNPASFVQYPASAYLHRIWVQDQQISIQRLIEDEWQSLQVQPSILENAVYVVYAAKGHANLKGFYMIPDWLVDEVYTSPEGQ